MSDLEENKRTVTSFYDLMFNHCRPGEAIEKYTGATYIQHNHRARCDQARLVRKEVAGGSLTKSCSSSSGCETRPAKA